MMAAAANLKVLIKNIRKFVPEKTEQLRPASTGVLADCNGKA